jgi:hypothetical protein
MKSLPSRRLRSSGDIKSSLTEKHVRFKWESVPEESLSEHQATREESLYLQGD